jgi:hypothetical protein
MAVDVGEAYKSIDLHGEEYRTRRGCPKFWVLCLETHVQIAIA